MNCDKCGQGSSHLSRQNETGVEGIFWCQPCITGVPEVRKGEPMTSLKQLERWVAGESVHNSTQDECCPDFSCCTDVKWPKEKRVEFAEAVVAEDDEKTSKMMFGALGALLSEEISAKKARIIGDEND